ncbi:hypothetical protein C900_00803 [Fulvivirga imtechensis AK7]|uniref:Type 1 periplasmic binding fold superfamily protein n=1 Tax=Fulvivirga imtechensis AK7 TaxID=1237149 RepID=L8K046_9BACT|nr:hypothetical protein [Fulvivirga imtechensis]ELR72842.1 hypothetical protein C900_00803 [Fulvivirga imtechensis AK7]
MKSTKYFLSVFILSALFILAGCGDDDAPEAENEEEVINEVSLVFTPVDGGTTLTFNYVDPDGEGTAAPTQDKITLAANTEYTLNVFLKNTVGDADEDITEEVSEEGEEHMLFYGWTEGLFATPAGNGNIDNRSDNVAYVDFDVNGLPVGLETKWKTGDAATGSFRLVLKHQPDVKSATSTVSDGESDIDLDWEIEIQ